MCLHLETYLLGRSFPHSFAQLLSCVFSSIFLGSKVVSFLICSLYCLHKELFLKGKFSKYLHVKILHSVFTHFDNLAEYTFQVGNIFSPCSKQVPLFYSFLCIENSKACHILFLCHLLMFFSPTSSTFQMFVIPLYQVVSSDLISC